MGIVYKLTNEARRMMEKGFSSAQVFEYLKDSAFWYTDLARRRPDFEDTAQAVRDLCKRLEYPLIHRGWKAEKILTTPTAEFSDSTPRQKAAALKLGDVVIFGRLHDKNNYLGKVVDVTEDGRHLKVHVWASSATTLTGPAPWVQVDSETLVVPTYSANLAPFKDVHCCAFGLNPASQA